MSAIQAFCIVALPLVAGLLGAGCLIPRALACRPALIAGYGLILGLLVATLALRIPHALGLGLTAGPFIAVATVTTVIAALLHRFCASNRPLRITSSPGAVDVPLTAAQITVLALLGALVAMRMFLLGYEMVQRPMFAWDATMHWATKAKVWFAHRELIPFLDNGQWLQQESALAYTDHHPDYPITLPLLQLWAALAIDGWSESLVNLPALLLPVSLAAILYGGGRCCHVPVFRAAVFSYLALSLPLLNIHLALAGNADLLLGVCYAGALVSLHLWNRQRHPGMLVLTLVLGLLCTGIKNEGLFWALTLVPGFIVALAPPRIATALLLTGLLAGLAVLFVLPQDWAVAGHTLGELALGYRPGALPRLLEHLAATESWHLLVFIAACLPFGLVAACRRQRALAVPAVALATAVGLYLALYLFTRHSYGAIHFSSSGRIALHLVPASLFLAMLTWDVLASRSRTRSA